MQPRAFMPMRGRLIVIVRVLAVVLSLTECGAPAFADSPAESLPPVPKIEQILRAPLQGLAEGYLTIDGLVALAGAAASTGFQLNITLNGTLYTITKSNAGAFLKALQARLDVYRQAILQHGSAKVGGNYSVNAGSSCRAESLDLRDALFGISDSPGEQGMALQLTVRQTGFKADLVYSAKVQGQRKDIVYPGVVVESAVVFAAPGGLDFNLYGMLNDNSIELRVNTAELRDALNATDADLLTLAKCVFLLTPK